LLFLDNLDRLRADIRIFSRPHPFGGGRYEPCRFGLRRSIARKLRVGPVARQAEIAGDRNRTALIIHTIIEEEILYPALRGKVEASMLDEGRAAAT
jgi:hypothetical protein